MSLQTTSANIGSQGTQAVQNYHYAPTSQRLDSITEQIVKTQDSALEAMKLIENGAAKRMWEAQKKMPSATWLGNLVDRLFGWGKYGQKSVDYLPQRKLLTHEQYPDDMCSKENTRSQNEAQKNRERERYIVWDTVYTSFEAQKYLNGSCSLMQPMPYYFWVDQFIDRDISGPNDIVCRIGDCMRERIMSCVPFCFPCENATDAQKHNFSYHFWLRESFEWALDNHVTWMYSSVAGQGNISLWKAEQIHLLFNATLKECEKQLFPQQSSGSSAGYYAILIIPVAIGGGIGVAVVLHKKRQRNMEYDPLGSGESNL